MVATGIVSHPSYPGQFIPTNVLNNSPLDLQPRQTMANPLPLCSLLRIRLDSHPLPPRLDIQIPQLDSTHSRLWPRCTTLGPNLVGSIRGRPLSPLDNRDSRHRQRIRSRSTSIPRRLALARRPGHPARRGLWDDPSADVDETAYLLYTPGSTGPRIHCYDLCSCLCAK